MNVATQIGKNKVSQGAARAAADRASERAQSRRMLVALTLLMVAIGVVAYRDRQFLFESAPAQTQATNQQPLIPPAVAPSNAARETSTAPPINAPSEVAAQKAASENAAPAVPAATQKTPIRPAESTSPSEPATHNARPASTPSKPLTAAGKHANANRSAGSVTTQAAQRSRVADITVQQPDTAIYPRLDQRTKIEGSVELQALVGTDGTIQELHVVRGPAVLGSAAREAVLQWKFKPYTQNGVAMETYAKITVNFTIKVVDGSPKTVASVEPEHVIILADNYQR